MGGRWGLMGLGGVGMGGVGEAENRRRCISERTGGCKVSAEKRVTFFQVKIFRV